MDDESKIPPPSRVGRPTGWVREESIDSAMNLFWRKGFQAVSSKDLADTMGIQRSSFYNSFRSREAVFIEALNRYATCSPDAPLDRVEPEQPVVPVLVSIMREICALRTADKEARGCLVCNSIAELVGVDESLGPMIEAMVRQRTSVLERLVMQAVKQGEMTRPSNPGATAGTLVAFLIGLNTLSKVVRDEAQLWSTCREFLMGLGVPKAALDSAI